MKEENTGKSWMSKPDQEIINWLLKVVSHGGRSGVKDATARGVERAEVGFVLKRSLIGRVTLDGQNRTENRKRGESSALHTLGMMTVTGLDGLEQIPGLAERLA